MDCFTVPTATFRALFCLVVLSHHRRKVVPFNVTARPTASWTAPQRVEAFPFDQAPQSWLRDRDPIEGEFFHCRVGGMGIEEVLISPACPIQTP